MSSKTFRTELRLEIEGEIEDMDKEGMEAILDKVLSDASEAGASVILSGSVENVERLITND